MLKSRMGYHTAYLRFSEYFPDAVGAETVFFAQLCNGDSSEAFFTDHMVAPVKLRTCSGGVSPCGASVGTGDVNGFSFDVVPDL
jgi:hypothetical protein